MSVTAYVGLGSNQNNPVNMLITAINDLDRLERTRVISRSSFYRTAPLEYLDQPDFVNAVCGLTTALSAAELLRGLLKLEASQGRVRGSISKGPRTLDLDLLLFGEEIISEQGLMVPHPKMAERRFVLEPLVEIEPGLYLPGLASVAKLLSVCPHQRVD
ncbi:MAG: 2-amino-4-hydroxy-6-hydroxymethyldihydropteridine diphosphokinase, partial [Gammaproteobacteria bacterium]|nr:2-amino-4-hydroxy-6-hydroxymethyldihydropteridine diphosphokinase [Gammaproteobacteria bacterium]